MFGSKKVLASVFLFALFLSSCSKENDSVSTAPNSSEASTEESSKESADVSSDENSDDSEELSSVTLKHISSKSLESGTHRPEILVADNGDIYLIVVEPEGRSATGQIKHQGYHYDKNWKQIGEAFPISYVTDEYGDPADHRAIIVEDKIVVVYQTNMWKDGAAPKGGQGPMEDYAIGQSLMMAQFSLEGDELSRVAIVDNAESGSGENFPDHAMAYSDGHLYITTGTGERKFNIREVSLSGKILSTHEYDANPQAMVATEVGNSLYFGADGLLRIISGNAPNSSDPIEVSTIDEDWEISQSFTLPGNGREETFPTGNYLYDKFTLISYISREIGGSAMDFVGNPYSPYLKVIDAKGNVLADEKIGDNGELHVHPTLAVSGDKIYFAWSKHVDGMPQVQVEEYSLSQ